MTTVLVSLFLFHFRFHSFVLSVASLVLSLPVRSTQNVLLYVAGSAVQVPTERFFRGPSDCMAHVVRKQGLSSCYKGLLPMALRDIPGYGIYILTYEWTFKNMTDRKIGDRHGFFNSVVAGGWAGVLSWAVVVPLDVIKSIVQADITKGNYAGMSHCIVDVYRQRGLRAFYAGFAVTTFRGLPQGCVTFLVYSQMLRILNGGGHF